MNALDRFKLDNKVVVITGGAGLLGRKHAEAVMEAGGIAVLLDINEERLKEVVYELKDIYVSDSVVGICTDITSRRCLENVRDKIINQFGSIDVLINNAANNPKVEDNDGVMNNRFEYFSIDTWTRDIAVGLTGAFLCAQVFGEIMSKSHEGGVILNISSDLGVIAPDQRIYRKDGLDENQQSIKPVTYSVVKHGLIGLTKYLATYYADKGIRCNALCPGGVFNNQDKEFLNKLENLIPLGRMADIDEYKSTIIYLISDASSYMTGSTVIVDGGRTCW